jgi:hypothetical protein
MPSNPSMSFDALGFVAVAFSSVLVGDVQLVGQQCNLR